MTRIAILMMLILGTTAAHSQSPAQHSAGNDIFRFFFSGKYDPKSRAHLADLFGAYCREILNTIPTNTPAETAWVAEEYGATDGKRLNRLVETKEWARHRLKEVFSGCVNEASILQQAQSQNEPTAEATRFILLAFTFEGTPLRPLANRLGLQSHIFDEPSTFRQVLLTAAVKILNSK